MQRECGACMKAHCKQNKLADFSNWHWTRRFSFIYLHTLEGAISLALLLPFKWLKACILKGYLSLTPLYGGFLERRGPKLKTTFNAENFICRLSRSISSLVILVQFVFTRESSYCFQHVLAIAILSVCLSVRPFVCLSHRWISQKRCKLGSLNFHHRLPGRL